MIVDSSALIAIWRLENDAQLYTKKLEEARTALLSVSNYLEIAMVVEAQRDPIETRRLDAFLKKARIIFEPVTLKQIEIARAAWRDFGRGSGHPAKLNYGDCFAYALAKDKDMPLLYKGSDFGHTDIVSALDS